jgi:hypothetical protein
MALMIRILKLVLVLASLAIIEAEKRMYQANEKYDLTAISLNETVHAFVDIPFEDSKVGTTEFMILSKSNGNAKDKWKYIAEVKGGGWKEVVYGGDDDKCIHIFERFVTNSNRKNIGQINTKGGDRSSTLLRVVFDEKVETGESSGRRIHNEKMTFTAETEGCYLFVYGGDNGGVSKDSDTNIIYKKDDPTSLYFGYGKEFTDESFFRLERPRRRGAVAGVKLTNRPDICMRKKTTEDKKKKKDEEEISVPTEEKIKDEEEDARTELEEDTDNKSTQSKYRMGQSFLPTLILFVFGAVLLFIFVAVVCSCPAKMGVSGTDGLTLYGSYLKKKETKNKSLNADDSSTIVTGGESVFRKEKKEINYDDDFEESA